MLNNRFYITFAFILFSTIVFSQPMQPDNITVTNFIKFQKNQFLFTENNQTFNEFYKTLDSCIYNNTEPINILHIGDSHIQANIFSNQLRQNIQKEFGINVGRGIIFPYKVAKTSAAIDFEISNYSQNWIFSKNIDRIDTNDLGLTGYSITTTKDSSFFTYKFLNNGDSTNKNLVVKLWHKKNENFTISIYDKKADSTQLYDNDLIISTFVLPNSTKDSIRFQFVKDSASNEPFTVYGFEIKKQNEKIKYHSEGVNSADVLAWLKTNMLISQICILQPKLILISLGANDGYKANFEEQTFFSNYDSLLEKIRNEFPNTAILLTTSGDSYQNKTFININNEKIRFEIFKLARKHNCGIWDFYDIMGGLNSISKWRENKLCKDDLLHFNRDGYTLIADLFHLAFMNDFKKAIIN